MSASIFISAFSLGISFCTFLFTFYYQFSQRPRLTLLMDKIIYKDKINNNQSPFIRLLMINEGYRPIIVSECIFYTSHGATCYYGIYDELTAPHGRANIVLPILIEPGKIAKLNLVHPNVFKTITKISVLTPNRKRYFVAQEKINEVKSRL